MNGRVIVRVAALAGLFALVAPIHVATKTFGGTSHWPRRFLAAAAWIIGVRVNVVGRRPRHHSLLVANHTSWLDILVLGGATGCAFVSKDALGHSLIHWLADQNGTVYVKRSHRKGAKDQAIALAKALEGAQPVVVFPEGTTGPGTHLLPFRSTLLEAASVSSSQISIRPVAVDYHENRRSVGWYRESAKENVLRVLGRRGTMRVSVNLLPALSSERGRKQLTNDARQAIAERLGLTSLDHSPIDATE